MNDINNEIQIIIESYDEINKSIIFKPYIDGLKKTIDHYESYSFDLKNCIQDEDLLKTLGKISKPILEKLIDNEKNDVVEPLDTFIKNNLNKKLKINSNELEEFAAPVEFTTSVQPITSSLLTFIL
jgi:hypothetical protein